MAATKKTAKYITLPTAYMMIDWLIAFETLGSINAWAVEFLTGLDLRISRYSGETEGSIFSTTLDRSVAL